ncbi:HAD-IIIA family hydrolase [Candidatus Sumerlaeota bacterium]|nr:HAD-IIIA family hydrolase [Candidatus Sumerlaeota bacterium]
MVTPQSEGKSIPPRVGLVVFDLDGTLADTFEDIAQATNHVLKAFGCPTLPTETIKGYVGKGARNLLGQLLGPDKQPYVADATALWLDYYERHPTDHTQLYPGAIELIEWLRAHGVRTAILSNKMNSLTQRISAELGLAARVDFVRGESKQWPRKPDPALLDHLIQHFGVKREEVLIVGDSVSDVELARNAGVAFCGVLTGQATREDLERLGATWVAENLVVLKSACEMFVVPPSGGRT